MLTFGNFLASVDGGDPRRGTFATGASQPMPRATAFWPTNAPAPSFGDSYGSVKTGGAGPIPGIGLDFGELVQTGVQTVTGGGLNSPAANGINTAQIDGNGGFLGALGNLSRAVMQGIGVQDSAPVMASAQTAPGSVGGIDIQTVAVFGLAAAAVYLYASR